MRLKNEGMDELRHLKRGAGPCDNHAEDAEKPAYSPRPGSYSRPSNELFY